MKLCTEVTGRNAVRAERKVSMYSAIRVIGCVLCAAVAALCLLQRYIVATREKYIVTY